MGLMLLKKVSLLFLLIISASLLSTCLAGRDSKWVSKLAEEADAINEGIPQKLSHHDEEESIHERLLKVNTKDYGRYDPTPALVKPPFKLIPN
ncbi:protein CASPARIAN STRIP INTEGRITY FACTOR 1-like isoform X1 [Quercus robur]|uniref:protein CASPARIAN STRIP INTEGRITY FACTOR 1-like isoform X1 n=1 Tax=Quercus robur TaxID=38942 RepID=UPI00216180E6|nr:protein CASPARIAN STRIP INTEGRITY FACTOR 1-like isoform X1 [Quercus robur]